ncbi:MAG: D-alanyl-D-alanine carboxypeptidase [Firmicutes bacterium]|nr:D-alanyl-D-alanine carboxypeptidase [Bacillota bacterium]
MRKIVFIFILLCLFCPIKTIAFQTNATSAILMDMDSQKIIYSKDIHNKRSVASISKIMTAILAIESNKLDDIITIGEEIKSAYGSGIYIKQGEHIRLIDLLYGLMLRSGNDAALAIANYVGGDVSKFVTMMNEKAKSLGMLNTEFNNPSGLDEDKGNYSTAYDMALLTSYAMKNKIYQQVVSTKRYKIKTDMNYYDWTNKNKFLFSYKYATGGKTGFTKIAKRTLVTTASKDNFNLVAVTLNDGNDFEEHQNLYEEAFSTITNHEILKKGNINIPGETYYKNNTFFIKTNFSYPIFNGDDSYVTIKYKLHKFRDYNDGDVIGEAIVLIDNEQVTSIPIYIRKNNIVKNNSFFKKILDWFKTIW